MLNAYQIHSLGRPAENKPIQTSGATDTSVTEKIISPNGQGHSEKHFKLHRLA